MIAVQRSQSSIAKLAYLFQRLVDLEAAWIPLVRSPELKLLLAKRLHRDAVAAQLLLERLPELLAPATPLLTCQRWADELDAAARLQEEADIAELLRTIELELERTCARLLAEQFPIGDEPSRRMIKIIAMDREELRDDLEAWQRAASPTLGTSLHPIDCDHRELRLAYDGKEALPPLVDLPRRPDHWHLNPSHAFYQPTSALLASAETMRQYCQHLYSEIEIPAIEVCARSIAEFRDMPIGFRVDMARQAWDEARHAHLAARHAAASGGFDAEITFSGKVWRRYLSRGSLAERLAIQQVIQEGNGFELALGRAEESAMTDSGEISNLLGFIAVDECQHALIGSKWLLYLSGGSVESYRQTIEQAAQALGFGLSVLNVASRLRTGLPVQLAQSPNPA